MLILFSCCNGDNSGSDIGTRAADFLSPEPYTELVVEMHAVKGFSYDPTFESLALEEIKQIIDKPGGITVRFFDDIEPASDENHVYSLNEIRNIESGIRKYYSQGDIVVLSILILDGQAEENTDGNEYLAYVHGPENIAVFRSTIREIAAQQGIIEDIDHPLACYIESTVLLHEFGHIAGLVKYNQPMVRDHEDPESSGHCFNQNCIMYRNFAQGSCVKLIYNRLVDANQQLHTFGEYCSEDLSAIIAAR